MFNLQSQLVLEYHHGGNQLQKSKHCAAPHHFVSLSFFEQGYKKKGSRDLIGPGMVCVLQPEMFKGK